MNKVKVKKEFIYRAIMQTTPKKISDIFGYENIFDFYDELVLNGKDYIEVESDFPIATILSQFLVGEDPENIVML